MYVERELNGVFLTGVTGFIGAHLLPELLTYTDGKVYCLVRPRQGKSPKYRVEETIRKWDLADDINRSRVVPIEGDLKEPDYGIGKKRMQQLMERVDLIHHVAGRVDFLAAYKTLKPVNVDAFKTLLRFAANVSSPPPINVITTMPAMYLYRDSSVTITEDASVAEKPDSDQAASSLRDGGGAFGYTLSKWVLEKVAQEAREVGFSVNIYRFTTVLGSTKTGLIYFRDLFWKSILGVIKVGAAPEIDIELYVVPVDFLARAQAVLSVRFLGSNRNFHLGHYYSLSIEEIVSFLCDFGYDIEMVSFDRWKEVVQEEPPPELKPFHSQFSNLLNMDRAELEGFFNYDFDVEKTLDALPMDPSEAPTVDRELFFQYLQRGVDHGHLPSP